MMNGGKAYIVLREFPIEKFNMEEAINMDWVKACRDWAGADHVLRTHSHFVFCETITDVEWEEI